MKGKDMPVARKSAIPVFEEVVLTVENEDDAEHAEWLKTAHDLYRERRAERGEGWKRGGQKAMIVNLQSKAERAFYQMFNLDESPNQDHLVDFINYAVFTLRLADDPDGAWPWGSAE
jgi:hypothetical protein